MSISSNVSAVALSIIPLEKKYVVPTKATDIVAIITAATAEDSPLEFKMVDFLVVISYPLS
jgi:hypothetical protein